MLVCIKQVPASNQVGVDPETGVILRDGAESKMNPYDLYAVETALRLREAYGGHITALCMGPTQAKAVLYEAFSMGVDDGILISDRAFGGADVLATSYALCQGARRAGHFDLILCGKQTTDGDTAQVGPELAEWLGLPSVSGVLSLPEVEGNSLIVSMDLPESVQKLRVAMPCLLAVEKTVGEPRLPSYVRRKATQNRELTILTLADMEDTDPTHYGLTGSPTQVRRIFPPAERNERELWQGSGDELGQRLHDTLRRQKII